MSKKYKKNHIIYYIQQLLANTASILITGSVIQSFLLECGCSENSVSIYMSVMQAIQVMAILLLARKVENIKNIFRTYAGTYFVQVALFVVMFYLSICHTEPVGRKYLYLFSAGLVVSLFQGINAVLGYKLPYYIIDMKHFGIISGITGVLIGIGGILFSGALSYFLNQYPYFSVTAVFSGIGLIFTIVTGMLIKNYENKSDGKIDETKDSVSMFRYKPFYQLLIPNICRGISNGIFLMIATIGYKEAVLNSSDIGNMVILSQVATIAGCFLFSVLEGKLREGKIILGSGLLFAFVVPFSFIIKIQNVFLVIYFIAYVLYVIVNYAIPVLIARRINYHCIGQYSAWRMVIHMCGTAVGNGLVPILLAGIGSNGILIVCGFLLVASSVGYYKFEKNSCAC